MDNRNLRDEQVAMLYEAIALIDEALPHLDHEISSLLIKTLHDARAKINAVATGERADLGPTV